MCADIKIKIGLNATCFNHRSSGAKQRFIGIYNKLFKLMPNSTFIIYEPANYSLANYFKGFENILFKKTPINSDSHLSKILVGYFFWIKEFKKEKFDIFEFFNLPLYSSSKFKSLMTIHDIRGAYSEYSFLGKLIYKSILRYAIKNSNQIITVSEFMKNDILKLHKNVDIKVIYNGISLENFKTLSKDDEEKIIKKIKIPENFILSVGHYEKRKNFLKLIDAFYKLYHDQKDLKLILVGNESDDKKKIINKINQLDLEKSVYLLEGLSDAEVKIIYRKAKLFVFPSLYEGFGIPILEAMISGCPIVLSNIDVFREITQNNYPYFDPLDSDSILKYIKKYLDNSKERNNLINYGLNRVLDFEFIKIAMKVKSLYISLLNK
tara:strand:- start:4485 stop:5621 length:1137 start_codon:yes stop_codon:yes gene_type:complete